MPDRFDFRKVTTLIWRARSALDSSICGSVGVRIRFVGTAEAEWTTATRRPLVRLQWVPTRHLPAASLRLGTCPTGTFTRALRPLSFFAILKGSYPMRRFLSLVTAAPVLLVAAGLGVGTDSAHRPGTGHRTT